MELIVSDDASASARIAGDLITRQLRQKPSLVLGLATGSSPMALYDELARRVGRGTADFSSVTAFALDEYVGLPAGHPQSYARVIDEAVTKPLRLDPARVHVPGAGIDASDFEKLIDESGGVDVQILGIGSNGHIAFNEPSSSFRSRTRTVRLSDQTRLDNARFFESLDDVPEYCVTQGIGTILESRWLVLLAQGEKKAGAIAAALQGPVSPYVPASSLQLHPRVTVLIDTAAACLLDQATDRDRTVKTSDDSTHESQRIRYP